MCRLTLILDNILEKRIEHIVLIGNIMMETRSDDEYKL